MSRVVALILMVFVAMLAVPVSTQAVVDQSELPPPVADPACEWYGTVNYSFVHHRDSTESGDGSAYHRVNRWSWASAPKEPGSTDVTCGSSWTGYIFESSYQKTSDPFCPALVGYRTSQIEGVGSGAGGDLIFSVDGSIPRIDAGTTTSEQYSVTATGTKEEQWACGGPVQTTALSETGAMTPDLLCAGHRAITPPPAGDNSTVYDGSCVVESEYQTVGWTWSFQRTCDPLVDSDGGGVDDCTELRGGTDRNDPSDDEVAAIDTDGDGIADGADNCPADYNPDQADQDGDNQGDACEEVIGTDTDGDGTADSDDNCPQDYNADQADDDGDGVGDACDNSPPVASADAASTLPGQSVSIDVLENDSDPDGDSLSLVSCTSPSAGTASVGSTVLYTPPSNFVGTATFECTIADDQGETATASVSVTVAGSVKVRMAIDYTAYWYNNIPNLSLRGKPGSDRVILDGATSVQVTGPKGENVSSMIQQICITPSFVASVDSNLFSVPVVWSDNGQDLMGGADDGFWDVPPTSVMGNFGSQLIPNAPACSSPGQSSFSWGSTGLLAETSQAPTRRVNLTTMQHEATVTILFTTGKSVSYQFSESEKAASKPPKVTDFDSFPKPITVQM